MSEKRCPHLTNEEISVFVDAIYNKQKPSLSGSIIEHIWKCKKCEQQIVQVYSIRYQDILSFPLGEQEYTPTSPGDINLNNKV